jgi:hypothetical protein
VNSDMGEEKLEVPEIGGSLKILEQALAPLLILGVAGGGGL